MKSNGCFRLLGFFIVALLISSAATVIAHPASPAHAASAPTGLHVVGNQIEDGAGHAIVPRGADRMGTEYACRAQGDPSDFDGPVDQASVSAMLTWDINIVRVPMNEDCWLGINGEPANGKTAAQYQTDIVNWVNLLNQNGMIVILDLHWNNSGTNASLTQEPMPDLDHAPAFWTSVANTFKSNSSVIFDLYNEPYPGFSPGSTTGWSCWKNGSTAASTSPCADVPFAVAGMQTLVNTVRATGATNILMLGGLAYSNDLTGWLTNEPTDPNNNLAASVHIYNFNTCNNPSCWNSQIAPVAAKVPVIAGEIGENDCAHGFIDALMSWLDSANIGYLGWTWTVVTGGCSSGPVLITDYTGTPTAFGAGLHDHLLALAATGGPPPAVSLTSPTMGQSFTSPATINLAATATAKNNKTIAKVEFYNGSTLVGTATTSPYSFSWTGVAANSYILTAKTYDSGGGTTVSAPVAVTVNAPGSTVIGCQMQYTMNQWDTGFSVGIKLTNNGTTTINGWTLTFSFSGNQKITQLWNGVLTQTGENISVKDAGYNATIAPGNYTSLGFNGTYSGVNNPPTIFFVNNQACTVA
ncbi:MAG TPA: cellulase family glycosylhydrolase [Ktedonobacteraceae bacterium]|nr:cellulase family glycosylhydrolase [Ktedonobacteraceae bacterium]